MIGDLKPHAAYKESGQDWLGSIPAHWSLLRAKRLFREVDERSKTGGEELLSVSHLTGVTPRRLKTVTMFMAESNVGHKVCHPGDLVINTLWAWMAALGVTKHTGLVSPAYGVYRPTGNDGILPAFAEHLLRTPLYAAEYQRRSTGVNSSRLRLYPEQFLRMPVLLPPLEEQAAIVRFLDWANGRLERTILAKRKVIALLMEQKRAVIQRAVTGGLDPSVPFKPSGVPWLGDIPKHWEVQRLKSLGTKFGSGVTPRGGASVYQDSGIPLLRSQNIHFGELRLHKVARIALAVHEAMAGTYVKAGDVLLNITGASIGRVCAVAPQVEAANVNQHVCIIRPIRTRCDSEYLAMFLGISAMQTAIYVAQSGSSREGLPVSEVKALRVALPPLNEQRAIRQTVQRETLGLRGAVSGLEVEIELLREYRTRLVEDVLTGKLDVRQVASRVPEDAAPGVPENLADETDEAELTDEETEA